eukprot:2012866-Ditylum_brightwellii.AAC.1
MKYTEGNHFIHEVTETGGYQTPFVGGTTNQEKETANDEAELVSILRTNRYDGRLYNDAVRQENSKKQVRVIG